MLISNISIFVLIALSIRYDIMIKVHQNFQEPKMKSPNSSKQLIMFEFKESKTQRSYKKNQKAANNHIWEREASIFFTHTAAWL